MVTYECQSIHLEQGKSLARLSRLTKLTPLPHSTLPYSLFPPLGVPGGVVALPQLMKHLNGELLTTCNKIVKAESQPYFANPSANEYLEVRGQT